MTQCNADVEVKTVKSLKHFVNEHCGILLLFTMIMWRHIMGIFQSRIKPRINLY